MSGCTARRAVRLTWRRLPPMPTFECAYDRIAYGVGMAEDYEVVRRQNLNIYEVL